MIGAFDRMMATDKEIAAKKKADRADNPKSANNGGAKPRWKARGVALSSIWTLFIIMGDYDFFGYGSWDLPWDDIGTAFSAWLMGVAVSFIVAWVFLNKRD